MTKTPLLFVDSNIFLDFYRAEGEAGLTLLDHIESVSDSLIISDQIEVEFLTNRQKVISESLKNVTTPSIPKFTPAYLSDSKTAAGIQAVSRAIQKKVTALRQRLTKILENPSVHDPVFKSFRRLVQKDSILNLKYQDSDKEEIAKSALLRYQKGCPPRKKQDTSIGDAINWEWILRCAVASGKDVLIVSRDSDYGLRLDGKCYLNDWLHQEFKDRVSPKRSVELCPSLAQALKKLSVAVTPEEEEEEQSIMARGTPRPPVDPSAETRHFWDRILEHLGRMSPFTKSYLVKARHVRFNGKVLEILFDDEFCEYIPLVDNEKNRSLLLKICHAMCADKVESIRVGRMSTTELLGERDSEAASDTPPWFKEG